MFDSSHVDAELYGLYYQVYPNYPLNSSNVKSRSRIARGHANLLLSPKSISNKTKGQEIAASNFNNWMEFTSSLQTKTFRKSLTSDIVLDWGFFFPTQIKNTRSILKTSDNAPKLITKSASFKRVWFNKMKSGAIWGSNNFKQRVVGGSTIVNRFSNTHSKFFGKLKRFSSLS
jgi:hypothetical protein